MNTNKICSKLLKPLFFAILFSGLLISCENIVDGDSKYSFKPDVSVAKGGDAGINVFSRYRSDNTDLIYIYRQEIPTTAGETIKEAENIGIIYQKSFGGDNTFNFQDQFVTETHKYRYYVIYHDSLTNEYFTSSASNEIVAKSGYGQLIYDTNVPSDIEFTELTSTLVSSAGDFNSMELSASASIPAAIKEKYIPTLVLNRYILNNSEKTEFYSRYFPLEDENDISKSPLPVLNHINLRDLVSDDFVTFDKTKPVTISIPGVVGMKIEYKKDAEENDTDIIQKVYFTSIAPLSIKDSAGKKVTEFNISTFQGTGVYLPPSPGSINK